MSKAPGERPPDAAAFLAELEEAASRRYGAGWLERASIAGIGRFGDRRGVLAGAGGGATGGAAQTVIFDATTASGDGAGARPSPRAGERKEGVPRLAAGSPGRPPVRRPWSSPVAWSRWPSSAVTTPHHLEPASADRVVSPSGDGDRDGRPARRRRGGRRVRERSQRPSRRCRSPGRIRASSSTRERSRRSSASRTSSSSSSTPVTR